MKISLVVPVKNEEASVAALIRSIFAQTRQPDETIFVDGGSTDRTLAILSELVAQDGRFRLIQMEQATPGLGRNTGIAASSFDWVALTDAGIQLDPSWLEGLARVVSRDPAVRMVYGNFEPVVNTWFQRCAALAYVPAKGERIGVVMRAPFIASSLLHRDVWRVVGGFPDLRASEDLIFMERVAENGFRTGWAPEATVWWSLQPSLTSTFKKFVVYSKHNVWAGRQADWHYGILRMYLAAVPFVWLALRTSKWWTLVPAAGAAARVAKSIWTRREGRGLLWALDPLQFAGVGAILALIDIATFAGWIEAVRDFPREVDKGAPPQSV